MGLRIETAGVVAAASGRTLRAFWLFLLVIALADIAFVAAFTGGFFETHLWFEEDGPVEDLQAVALAVAALVAAWHALTQRREGHIVSFGIVAVFLACCVRELEFRNTAAPDWLIWLFHGTGQNIFIVTIFAVFAVCYVRRWRELPAIISILWQRRTAFYIAAGVLLLVSSAVEATERQFHIHLESIEEWLELNGYLLFLLATWFLPYNDRRVPAGARHSAEIR